MSQGAHDLRPGYWTSGKTAVINAPSGDGPTLLSPVVSETACARCGTEFLMGAKFCHACGLRRKGAPLRIMTAVGHLREVAGLTIPSVIAAIAGVLCVIMAIATGFVFQVTTVIDWQAIQIWRIEWMLGAIAAFLLGIIFRKVG